MPPNIWSTPFTSGNVFTSPLAHPSSSYTRIPTPWNHPDAGRIPEGTPYGAAPPEDGDGGKGEIPKPRFLRSSSTGNSFHSMKGKNFKICGVDQQRLLIPEPHFDKFPTPQTSSCWKIRFTATTVQCLTTFHTPKMVNEHIFNYRELHVHTLRVNLPAAVSTQARGQTEPQLPQTIRRLSQS